MKKLFVFMLVCFVSVISCFAQEKKGYMSPDKTAGGEIAIFNNDDATIVSFVYVMENDARYWGTHESVWNYYVVFKSNESAKAYYNKMIAKIKTFQDFFNLWMYHLSNTDNHYASAHEEYEKDGVYHSWDVLNKYDF